MRTTRTLLRLPDPACPDCGGRGSHTLADGDDVHGDIPCDCLPTDQTTWGATDTVAPF
ncbi:hypothetical protein ACN20G_36895 (plasmid) [Streptomyces sp. BI20]|uniref:hypothetical protein n=1 Tax=Streptomyces sp. BI20 TaxID=3403460 RepID=UPI003C7807E5